MLDADEARAFAQDRIESWNAHDMERILSHYEDGFEMTCPVIISTMDEPSGTLRNKAAIAAYWGRVLERYRELHFELLHLLHRAGSVTIIYNGVRGLSAEVFHFSPSGKVQTVRAQYMP
ncbi:MAG: ketosteroid isomerase-like protein [Bacteroidia bacterium]|jgi:ketosteroid isomerase-like protein